MDEYRELRPPPHLAGAVECFWFRRQGEAGIQRVTPDGCADILFTAGTGKPALHVVGAMTRYEDFALAPGQLSVGVRFRPGMWAALFGVPAAAMTDAVVPLEDLWGARGAALLDRLAGLRSAGDRIALFSSFLLPPDGRTPVQRAIAHMERHRGAVSVEDTARETGLSARQFRRACLKESGLAPKLLARILRFRHASARVRAEAGDHAGLAAECGYADQAHFIAEFRRFCGRTPGELARTRLPR